MAYLFDTDAISETLRSRPLPEYVAWLETIPREEQFTSAVVIGELFEGAFLSPHSERHLKNIEERVLPAISVLPYDAAAARVFGQIQATLAKAGTPLGDPDAQIAATAIYHDLEIVTGNLRHFSRVPGIKINPILDRIRRSARESS